MLSTLIGLPAGIVAAVRDRGDAALLEYTNRYDRMAATSVTALEIPADEMRAALAAGAAMINDVYGLRAAGAL